MINGFCCYGAGDGMRVHATGFLSALRKLEPVAIVPWRDVWVPDDPSPEVAEMAANGARFNPSDISIGIGRIEHMLEMTGRRRHAFVVWEASLYPKDKLDILLGLEELWTSSEWGRNILINNGIAPEKVFVVPEGVDPDAFRPVERLAAHDRPFRFLCAGKWETRKNIGQLVEAFTQEFNCREPVELVVHSSNVFQKGFDLRASIERFAVQPHAPIRISSLAPGVGMAEVYNSCDAFVLPTRAEGWGLPVLEAMSCGLPAIVTNYSAPVDYLNETNGYPLRVAEMIDIYDPFFYPCTWDIGQWAQPDHQHLRQLLRHVFEHPQEAREKGRAARASVLERWTWDHAAATAYRRLHPERITGEPRGCLAQATA